jgi:diguanylate cyclase (GGDEF)-like protein
MRLPGLPSSLRARLLLASLLVEGLMLALLVANSARLIEQGLLEQMDLRLRQTSPLLNAALNAPLAQRDYATIQQILRESRQEDGLKYLVLFDHRGKLIAAEGRPGDKPLPPPDHIKSLDPSRSDQCLHAITEINLAGQKLGTLHFGISTAFLGTERNRLVRESLELGAGVLLFTLLVLASIGLWITHSLTRLTDASKQLSAGNYDVDLPTAGWDEVDQLSAAFAQMATTIKGRVEALTRSEALQRRYFERARDERARLASLLAALKTGIVFVNTEGVVVYYNATFGHIWLIPPEAALVGNPMTRLHPFAARLLAGPQGFMSAPASGEHEVPGATEFRLLDQRIVTQTTYPVLSETGEQTGRIWLYEDVTRQRQTAELANQAERDALTGLYNRRGFELELERLTRAADEHQGSVALYFIDLDGFKGINDTYGHRAGDAILVQVASEFQAQIRRREFLARLGGDEFAVLVPNLGRDELTELADRIVKAIASMPIRYTGRDIGIGCSLGIAVYPEHAASPDELLARADEAMYRAKQAGKNRWHLQVPGQASD